MLKFKLVNTSLVGSDNDILLTPYTGLTTTPPVDVVPSIGYSCDPVAYGSNNAGSAFPLGVSDSKNSCNNQYNNN